MGSSFLGGSFAHAKPGDRDVTFGQRGGFGLALPGFGGSANHVFQQGDGKLVAVGYESVANSTLPVTYTNYALVLRFNADGSLDTTFNSAGTPGRVRLGWGVARGGVQRSDGKLLIAGSINGCMSVARLQPNGILDTTFGVGGNGVASFSDSSAVPFECSPFSAATDVFIEPSDNSIIVAGTLKPAGRFDDDFAFVKFSANGLRDTSDSFGVAGIATVDYSAGSEVASRAIRHSNDGSFIVVGQSQALPGSGDSPMLIAAKIDSSGQLATSFADGGVLSETCYIACAWYDIVEQADGELILVGATPSSAASGTSVFQGGSIVEPQSLIIRVDANGEPDVTFGNRGRIERLFVREGPTIATSGDEAISAVVEGSGNILILGALSASVYTPGFALGGGDGFILSHATNDATVLARLKSSGQLDNDFGAGGIALVTYGTAPPPLLPERVAPKGLLKIDEERSVVLGASGQSDLGTMLPNAIWLARISNGAADAGVISATFTGPILESIGTAEVQVHRRSGSTGAITVDYSTLSGTALAGSDFTAVGGTLRWADGDDSIKFVSIPILSDTVTETSDETFSLVFSNLTGGAEVKGPGTIDITIARDDVQPINAIITLTQTPLTIAESAGEVTLTVTRTRNSKNGSVNFYTVPLTAQAGRDFTPTRGILIWDGDSSPRTITVPIINNSTVDGERSFKVVLTTPGGSWVLGGQTATVSILEDDAPPMPASPAQGNQNSNGGGAFGTQWLFLLSGLMFAKWAVGGPRRDRMHMRYSSYTAHRAQLRR